MVAQRRSLPRRAAGLAVRLLAALIVALSLAEGAVRVAGLRIPPRMPTEKTGVLQRVGEQQVPGVGLMLRPLTRGEEVYPGCDKGEDRTVVYEINALGFRDRPTRPRPAEGVYRIALVGDSVTYGTGVRLEETIARQLEPLLRGRFPGREIEVLNCGVPATNTGQQVAHLAHRVLPSEPRLVLILTTIVDATGYGIRPVQREKPVQAQWIERLGLTSGVFHDECLSPAKQRLIAWRERSVLLDLVAHRLYRALYGSMSVANYKLAWDPDGPGVASIRAALTRARALSDEHRFRLCVAMYPSLIELSHDYPFCAEVELLRSLCAELQLPFVDLLEPLEGWDADLLRAHVHDRHPNGRANTIVANALAEVLAPMLEADLHH